MEAHNYVNKVIALVRPRDIMVQARGGIHEYDNIRKIFGSDFDLMLAHTQIKDWRRQ